MRQRVSLMFIQDGCLLVMGRRRNGLPSQKGGSRSYHVLPGGGVEPGESFVEAAYREAKEETNFDITLGRQLWRRTINDIDEIAFLVTHFEGVLQLGGPEAEAQSPNNQFYFHWVPLAEVNDLSPYPGPIDLSLLPS